MILRLIQGVGDTNACIVIRIIADVNEIINCFFFRTNPDLKPVNCVVISIIFVVISTDCFFSFIIDFSFFYFEAKD